MKPNNCLETDESYPRIPLKYVATINDEALEENTDPELWIDYIDIGNVDSSGAIKGITSYRLGDAPSRARRIVRDGDVIISTVRTYLQAIAPIEAPSQNLIVSTGFAVVRPKPERLDAGYCKYALREPAFLSEVVTRSVGANYPAINASELGSIPIHSPTITQQCAIATYLDQHTARFDELIAAKQYLLDLLAEKRQALITHAVTRGLDPAAPLRDSGVPWLGEIPAHWEVSRLKTVCESLQTGPFGSQLHAEDYIENGIPFINPIHLVNGRIVSDARVTVSEESAARLSVHQLRLGDVVFARRGEIGRCAVVTKNETGWLCGSGSLRARPIQPKLNPDYLVFVIANSYAGEMLLFMSVGTTMNNLNSEIVGDLVIPLPPIEEQEHIVNDLKLSTSRLDMLVDSTLETIKLLQERRSALIASTVTGQIDVTEQLCN